MNENYTKTIIKYKSNNEVWTGQEKKGMDSPYIYLVFFSLRLKTLKSFSNSCVKLFSIFVLGFLFRK